MSTHKFPTTHWRSEFGMTNELDQKQIFEDACFVEEMFGVASEDAALVLELRTHAAIQVRGEQFSPYATTTWDSLEQASWTCVVLWLSELVGCSLKLVIAAVVGELAARVARGCGKVEVLVSHLAWSRELTERHGSEGCN